MLKVLRSYIENLLAERGLEISKAKSSLFNIKEQDFEFLGFSFDKKRFNYKKCSEVSLVKKQSYKSTSCIIIKPSNDNLRKFKNKVRDVIGSHTNLFTFVLKLNEYLRGWAIYFTTTGDSAECVRKLHRFVLLKCWDKIVKLHPSTPRKALRKRFFPKLKFYQLGRYVECSWVFSVLTKLERPSVDDALLRFFNLDSIRAPGNAQIPMKLNAYEKADRERLENRILYTNFPFGTVEKICRRQKFICLFCGQSLSNGEGHWGSSFAEFERSAFACYFQIHR